MFLRVVTRKGRQYLYEEERYRDGAKVRSRSRSLGPINGEKIGWLRAQFPRTYGIDWDQIERDMHARMVAEDAKAKAFAEKMHAAYGMNLTTPTGPQEKPVAPSPIEAPAKSKAPDAQAANTPAPAPEQQTADTSPADPDQQAEADGEI